MAAAELTPGCVSRMSGHLTQWLWTVACLIFELLIPGHQEVASLQSVIQLLELLEPTVPETL